MSSSVRRVCLLGAESTGKSTLARDLAAAYGTLWNPEYGRPYTEVGRDADAPWTSDEFTQIACLQCWYEDFLADYATQLLFCDTDAFTTALFHQVYLGSPTAAFDDLVARPYDLFLVCGLDIPWARDSIREFDEQRRWMHEQYVDRAKTSGVPWLLVEGGAEERVANAQAVIDAAFVDRA